MTKNLRLKLISILAAIFLWMYVVATVNPSIEREYRNIPISYKNLDTIYENDYDIVGERDVTVDVTLSGKTNDFINVSEADIRAEVDLANFDDSSSSIPISFYVPEYLALEETSLTEVPIRIEKVISKEIGVELVQEGTPADDLAVVVGSIIPESIVVEGASSLVEAASKAVAYQDMSQVTSDTTRNLPVAVVNSQGEEIRGLDLSQNFVNVSYDIYQLVSLPVELVTEGDYKENISFISSKLSQESVNVMVPADYDDEMDKIKTKPFDLSQVSESGSYDVDLDLPEGIQLRDKGTELSINFEIAKNTSKTFELNMTRLEIRNSSHDDSELLANDKGKIRIEFYGPEAEISKLRQADIKLFVDAEGLDEGIHNLAVQVDQVQGLSVEKIEPDRVSVRLGPADEQNE